MQIYVAGLLFNPERTEVVLVRKNRPEWQAGLLNAVGGKLEGDETPAQAMVREFQEETGLFVDTWKHRFNLRRDGQYSVHFFTAVSADYQMVRTMESETIAIWDVHPLPAHMVKNLYWIIPLLLDDTVSVPGVFYDVAGN